MYKKIKALPYTRELYLERLLKEAVLTQQEADKQVDDYRNTLDNHGMIIKTVSNEASGQVFANWQKYVNHVWTEATTTKLTKKELLNLGDRLLYQPADLTLQTQVAKEYDNRKLMLKGELPFNWGFAETLAYASLVSAGYSVRLSGQDCGRGTFAHRHAVLHDQNDGHQYVPLHHISDQQAQFTVIDSVLSEAGVLGFEYGFATTDPEVLVLWEAQYGDFANGAQVVIDQFITSGEQKWRRLCGLTLLLPHSYEGAGPEHSSARLERFLQACAQKNIQVCVPSTPAQMFHMLRRQMLRPYRKPLVVMTPKSLLRHKLSTSPLEAFTDGEFQLIIPEVDDIKVAKTKRMVLCSGKVYFDLLQARREQNNQEVAIVRVEQLYPFPQVDLTKELQRYAGCKDIVWCQEEPQNQGAWYSINHRLRECLAKGQELRYIGRQAQAAPATGYTSQHLEQQKALVHEALKIGQ